MRMQLITGQFPAELLRAAERQWPTDDWPGWFCYDNADERKRVCPDWKQIPEPCRQLLGLMANWPPEPGLIPDLSLYGGGMHSMGDGGRLALHLDADTHKLTGLRRRYSTVLFLSSDWDYAGEFRLWSADRSKVLASVRPEAGLLCAFECTEDAFHDVQQVNAPPDVRRKGLALFWYGLPEGATNRPRAMFLGAAGERVDDFTKKQRIDRAGIRKC